ncbi:MAG: hypothetical protein B6U97_05005 [Candidatus Altiarchaeales archaeon ex4484_96]|nr:MAG: hypothetical protein B6U97_05005 [Candidatus Altiarchaeales archaeon ex4484_96]
MAQKDKDKKADSDDLKRITEEVLNHGVDGILHEEKELTKSLSEKKKEWEIKNLLNKAKKQEKNEEYRKAIEYYLEYIENYLQLIETRDKYTLKDYYKAADYYTKVAELYKKTPHIRVSERIVDLKKASKYYEKAAKIYLKGNKHNHANKSFLNSAELFHEIGLFELCAKQYTNIAEVYRLEGDKLLVSEFYEKAADEYKKAENYPQTIEMILEAAKLKGDIKNLEGMSEDYKKIADIYRSIKEHDNAIKYYAKSVEILYGIEKFNKLREIYDGIALDYEGLTKYDDAIFYFLSSAYLNKNKDNYAASNSFEGVARCFRLKGDYIQAIEYYLKSAELRADLGKYLDAAIIYKCIADCYRAMGDAESAAEYYFRYAEYGLMDEKGLSSIEGFKIASDIYLKLAESLPQMSEEKLKKVIALYKKLGKSYSGLRDYPKSGDSYFRAADLEQDLGFKKQTQTFMDAIKEYEKADKLWDIGRSYNRIKQYSDAAEAYIQYAKKNLEKERIYYTGEGYRKAGENNSYESEIKKSSENYNKALKYYFQYLEKTHRMRLIEDEHASPGNTLTHIGECYMGLGNLDYAREYFERAMNYYESHEDQRSLDYVKPFHEKVKAKIIMRSGDYVRTNKLLDSSLDGFTKLIGDKKYDKEYISLFKKNKKEVEDLIDSINKKPEISLLMDRKSYTFKSLPVILNIEVENNSLATVKNVNFLPHLPDELKIFMEPKSIEKIGPGEKIRTAIELFSDYPGDYRLKPIEIIYEDEMKVKYVKACNVVGIHVMDRPSKDYKDYHAAVNIYLDYAKNQAYNLNHYHSNQILAIKAILTKVNAKISMDQGFYEKATELLDQAEEELTIAINKGGWTEEYEDYLDKNTREIIVLKKEIDIKPPVKVEIDYPDNIFRGKEFTVNARVINNWDKPISRIRFLNKVPGEDLQVIKTPTKISLLKAGESMNVTVILLPLKKGEYEFKVFDISYKDDKGTSYTTGSAYLTIDSIEPKLDKGAKVKDVGRMPEVSLIVDRESRTFRSLPVILNLEVVNNSSVKVHSVSFLPHLPDDIKIFMEPKPVDVIEPGESVKTSIELVSDVPADYKVKPVEVIYNDLAGKRYVKASNLVALSVLDNPGADYKDYNNAIATYKEYAKNQIENENFYHAAEGYRRIAEIYGRFGETARMNEAYEQAIESYNTYLGLYAELKDLTTAEKKRISDSYRYLGECFEILNNLKKSKYYLEKSIPSYKETIEETYKEQSRLLLENQMLAIEAVLAKVNAMISIDQGFYDEANKLFDEAENKITTAVTKGGWTEEYEAYLDKNLREINTLRKEIQSKPWLEIKVSYPLRIITGREFTVKAEVKNPGKGEIKNLGFLSKPIKDFALKETPGEIPLLKPGQSETKDFTLIPKTEGNFDFKLFDVSYKDEKGNNYSIGSEYIRFNVSPAEAVEETLEEEKPQIDLFLDGQLMGFVGEPMTLNVGLINAGLKTVREVVFLILFPEDFEVMDSIETISKMEPGESIKNSITIKPKQEGEYDVTPIQLYYKDPKGNKYTKKSDTVNVVVKKSRVKTKKEESIIEGLLAEKAKLERMIDIARSKYHKREIAEEAYRDMVEDYEKRIIELDVDLECYGLKTHKKRRINPRKRSQPRNQR